MAKLLLNADGKVLMKEDKVYKAPESTLKKLLDTTKKADYMFYQYQGENVDDLIKYDDTENVESMSRMFNNSKITKKPNINTKKCKVFSDTFGSCKLIEIVINTDSAYNVQQMFGYSSSLLTIDITSLDKVTSSTYLNSFALGCNKLTKLIIRTMTVIPPLHTQSFLGCHHFTGTVHSTYNPDGLKDGRIYVPDDFVEQLKQATNWSEYGDIIVPLSTLEE